MGSYILLLFQSKYMFVMCCLLFVVLLRYSSMKNNGMVFDGCHPECPVDAVHNRNTLIWFLKFTLLTTLGRKNLASFLLLENSLFVVSLSPAKISRFQRYMYV